MKQSIGFYEFDKAFQSIRPDNFSYEGRQALYDYLIELEESMDEELELDVIAFCCDYTEDTITNTCREYNCEDLDDLISTLHVIWHDDENILYCNQ